MSTIKTKEGIEIFYKDSGRGEPILFSHGWPLSADAWDSQMLYFEQKGYRVIAHDRRGHGRSSDTWDNNTMDQYADDLAELIEHLDLRDITLIGHSTGGGEVTRYIGRHGSSRVSRLILVSAIPPLMLKTKTNPEGLPLEAFDDIRKNVYENRAQFFLDLTQQFYNFNRPNAHLNEGIRQSFWLQGMVCGIKSVFDCVKQFSESDLTEDLKKIDVPTLIIHGDDDQIVPFRDAALKSVEIIPDAELKIYGGSAHGLAQLEVDRFNTDVLRFVQSGTTSEIQKKAA